MGLAIIIPNFVSSCTSLGKVTPGASQDAVALNSLSVGAGSQNGNTVQFSVSYSPSNTTQKGVSWSITSGGSYASITSQSYTSCTITVNSTATSNQTVKVRATSSYNSSKYAEASATVKYVGGGVEPEPEQPGTGEFATLAKDRSISGVHFVTNDCDSSSTATMEDDEVAAKCEKAASGQWKYTSGNDEKMYFYELPSSYSQLKISVIDLGKGTYYGYPYAVFAKPDFENLSKLSATNKAFNASAFIVVHQLGVGDNNAGKLIDKSETTYVKDETITLNKPSYSASDYTYLCIRSQGGGEPSVSYR